MKQKVEVELTDSDICRFFSHVVIEDDCFTWKGSRHVQGYGLFRVKDKVLRANRVAFCIYNGYWPIDEACHTCNNPPCIRRGHLYDGTRSQNQRDIVRTPDILGRTKLSIEDVRRIRLFAQVGYNTNKLMKMYNLSRNATNNIIARRSFKDVE